MKKINSITWIALGMMLVFSPIASANIINVNSTSDSLNAGDGNCTLREAINNANNDNDSTGGDCGPGGGTDTINLPAGTYRMSISGPGDDVNATGDFDITQDLNIFGVEGAEAVIQGLRDDRVFDVRATSNDLTLQDLVITGGNAVNGAGDDDGGAVRIQTNGILTLTRVTVSENVADDNGGGIACIGCSRVDLTDSDFTQNAADDDGSNAGSGGAVFYSGAIPGSTVQNSNFGDTSGASRPSDQNTAFNGGAIAITGNTTTTFSGNTFGVNQAANNGGAIHDLKSNSAETTIVNTTFSGNTAQVDGGAIYINDTSSATPSMLLLNNTITNNSADSDENGTGDGGGIHQDGGDVDMTNNIVAGNNDFSSEPDCSGTFNSAGNNFIGVNDGCAGSFAEGFPNGTGDFVGTETDPVDPELQALALIPPGRTPVHLPQGDSPVIDEGDNATCAGGDVNNEDQREITRPQQFDGVNRCDIGAVELQRFERFATTQTIRVSTGFNIPFHCGQERVTFRNNGDKVDSIELNETIVSIVFPESRISNSPSARDQAQVVQSATLNDPANFQTAGVMSAFVLATLNPGKTYRITCEDIQKQPVLFNADGSILQTIEDTQSAPSEFFQGILAIQSTQTIEVTAKKVKRVWIGVPDGGSGVEYTNGEHIVSHLSFTGTRTSGSRSVNVFVSQTGLPTTSASLRDLIAPRSEISKPRLGHIALLGKRMLQFEAQGISTAGLDVVVYGLNGRLVYSDTTRDQKLRWNLRDNTGRPIANGVYLYVLTAKGPDGQVFRSGVKKLIVLR